jgi:hypothetical protein
MRNPVVASAAVLGATLALGGGAQAATLSRSAAGGTMVRRRRPGSRPALAALALGLGLGLAGTPAQAVVYTVTAEGTVSEGTDVTGVFGLAGLDLAGLTFQSMQTFDDALGFYANGPNSQKLLGGQTNGAPSLGSATLKLFSGVTELGSVTVDGAWTTMIEYFDHPGVSNPYHLTYEYDATGPVRTTGYIQFGATAAGGVYPAVVGGYTGNLCAVGSCYGSFFREVVDLGETPADELERAFGRLTVTSLRVTSGAVPEPATWAMMLLGFCGLGAMMRRRRVTAA